MEPTQREPPEPSYVKTIYTLDNLVRKVGKIRKNHEKEEYQAKIAWTNGCFNLLHHGHVRYLSRIKPITNADFLIVGVNNDASVVKNKKGNKLISSEQARAEIIAALEFPDYVLLIEDTDMTRYLDALRPDFYVKGGDYTIDTINQPERRLVEGYGGEIVIIPAEIEVSTTKTIERIVNKNTNLSAP